MARRRVDPVRQYDQPPSPDSELVRRSSKTTSHCRVAASHADDLVWRAARLSCLFRWATGRTASACRLATPSVIRGPTASVRCADPVDVATGLLAHRQPWLVARQRQVVGPTSRPATTQGDLLGCKSERIAAQPGMASPSCRSDRQLRPSFVVRPSPDDAQGHVAPRRRLPGERQRLSSQREDRSLTPQPPPSQREPRSLELQTLLSRREPRSAEPQTLLSRREPRSMELQTLPLRQRCRPLEPQPRLSRRRCRSLLCERVLLGA